MASILDDYLSTSDPLNEPPSTGIPPVTYNSGGGSAPVALPFHETQTKTPETTVTRVNPKYTETTVKTPESKTTAAQTGGTTNWSETQKVINTDYKPESREDFAKRTGARAVIDQLVMQKPKPTGDPERMRKIAGVQAIGEALRNVVDAVYGARKAKIDPHKSYSDNLLTQAKNMDSTYAGQLKEYFKTLNDAEKKLTDDYLRMLMSEKDAKYKSKTIGGSNRDITTTTTTPEKTVTTIGKVTGGGSVATRTGGTIEKTGVRSGFNNGAGGETDKQPAVFTWTKYGQKVAQPADVEAAAMKIAQEPLAMKGVDTELKKKVLSGTATYQEAKNLVQQYTEFNPEGSWEIAQGWGIPTTRYTPTNIPKIISKTTSTSGVGTPIQTTPVKNYSNKSIKDKVEIGKSKANDPFAKFGGSQRK
jgi:hypothetical protein